MQKNKKDAEEQKGCRGTNKMQRNKQDLEALTAAVMTRSLITTIRMVRQSWFMDVHSRQMGFIDVHRRQIGNMDDNTRQMGFMDVNRRQIWLLDVNRRQIGFMDVNRRHTVDKLTLLGNIIG
ncbi:hypothetical protein BsWGS_29173 [Bradybaena similaris]